MVTTIIFSITTMTITAILLMMFVVAFLFVFVLQTLLALLILLNMIPPTSDEKEACAWNGHVPRVLATFSRKDSDDGKLPPDTNSTNTCKTIDDNSTIITFIIIIINNVNIIAIIIIIISSIITIIIIIIILVLAGRFRLLLSIGRYRWYRSAKFEVSGTPQLSTIHSEPNVRSSSSQGSGAEIEVTFSRLCIAFDIAPETQ